MTLSRFMDSNTPPPADAPADRDQWVETAWSIALMLVAGSLFAVVLEPVVHVEWWRCALGVWAVRLTLRRSGEK